MKKKTAVSKKSRSSTLRAILLVGIIACIVYVMWMPDTNQFVRANPKSSSLIRERRNNGVVPLPIIWTPLDRISPTLITAVIVSEDASFYSHNGFDFQEMSNAFVGIFTRFRFRGASTITQQLAKNLYLSESRNPLRKIKEAIIARALEEDLTKRRILELYLNIIEWGDGIFGIGQASQKYFGVPPSGLTQHQAAYLAAIIPSPTGIYNPKKYPARVISRARAIEAKLKRVRY